MPDRYNSYSGIFCMALIVNNAVIVTQQRNFQAALSSSPKTQKLVRETIRQELFEARRQMMSSVPLQNDPREARRAIRTSVYKKILGGQINILPYKKRHATISYEPPRTLVPGQRGGNRRKRSLRTKQIMSYGPLDRQFILRFVNSGTRTRVIGFRNDKKSNRERYERLTSRIHAGDKFRTGNRGAIAPRNWFMRSAESNLGIAAQNIADIIDSELSNIISGKTMN